MPRGLGVGYRRLSRDDRREVIFLNGVDPNNQ